MSDGVERRVTLKLFPSNPKTPEEVVEIPVEQTLQLSIHAKNTSHRGDVRFTPQGRVIFHHNIAKVRPAPSEATSFSLVESDGLDESGDPHRERTFRLKPGGVLGLWPQETKTDRIMYQGRRFLRLEASAMIAE